MEHFGTLQGHSGAICGVVLAEGLPEFLTVSEDRSLRRWKRTTGATLPSPRVAFFFFFCAVVRTDPVRLRLLFHSERPGGLRGPVAALCFSRGGDLLLAGYESGLLEVWRRGAAVGRKQVRNPRKASWTRLCVCVCVLVALSLTRSVCVCLFRVRQVSDGTLTAICSMPGERFAVSYEKLAVDVWKVVWDGQRRLAR